MEISKVIERALKYLAPPPPLTVSEWADEYRYLNQKTTHLPGKWSTDNTPYMREPMDCVTDAAVERIVFKKPIRIGGTESLVNNAIAYHIHYDPCPMIYVQSSLDEGRKYSSKLFDTMVEVTPVLKERVGKSKESKTRLSKSGPGWDLNIVGAKSAKGFTMVFRRLVICDDVNKYEVHADSHGDPIKLAEGRARNVWNKKIILIGPPGVEGACRITQEYELSDRRLHYIPCPHCGEYQTLEFGGKDYDFGLKWKGDDVWYLCRKCRDKIQNHHKPEFLRHGQWKAESEFNGTAGFWLNGLYSPWYSWDELKKDFLEATGTPEKLKVFNTETLAITWQEKGDAPAVSSVSELRLPYKFGEVPEGVRLITCGVDVQDKRLIYAIRGWGVRATSWLLESGEVWGETDKSEGWDMLARILELKIGNNEQVINRMLIDSGYRADMVYAFCRRFPMAIATKGHDSQDKPVRTSRIDVTISGKVHKRGLVLWHVDTDYFKSWVYGRIRWDTQHPGAWFIAEDTPEDYCKQVVSESLIILENGKRIWKKHGANHFLDCEVLNAVGAFIMKAETLQDKSAQAIVPKRKGRRMISEGVKL